MLFEELLQYELDRPARLVAHELCCEHIAAIGIADREWLA